MNSYFASKIRIVTLLVSVMIVGIFGATQLSVSLFPDINKPLLTISSGWQNAAPKEIESEIIKPIETVLESISGVESMVSSANPGSGRVQLKFKVGVNIGDKLVEVINRLNQISNFPADAVPPSVSLLDNPNSLVTWLFLQIDDSATMSVEQVYEYSYDVLIPQLEQVDGVAKVSLPMKPDKKLYVEVDPYTMANLGVRLNDVFDRINGANNVSAGFARVSKNRYSIRFQGRYLPEEMQNILIPTLGDGEVRLGDFADIKVGHEPLKAISYQNGKPAIFMRVDKSPSGSLVDISTRLGEKMDEIQPSLNEQGLTVTRSYDASVFIYRAISFLAGSLALGFILSSLVLSRFFSSKSPIFIILSIIPMCLCGAMIFLHFMGYSLNVISMAGLAFAIGMMLDAAIVVVENALRLKNTGIAWPQAIQTGVKQVKGALFVSTLTTVVIFVPIIFTEDIGSKVFSALAINISVPVLLSLFFALYVIPLLLSLWPPVEESTNTSNAWKNISRKVMAINDKPVRRLIIIVSLTMLPLFLSYLLIPKLDYLPDIKRDAIDADLFGPAGLSLKGADSIYAKQLVDGLEQYRSGEKQPQLNNYYVTFWSTGATIGIRTENPQDKDAMMAELRRDVLKDLPDADTAVFQGSLLASLSSGSRIDVHFKTRREINELMEIVGPLKQAFKTSLDGAVVYVQPSLDLVEPEMRLYPKDENLRSLNVSRNQLADFIQVVGDGRYIGEYFNGDEKLDVMVKTKPWENPDEILNMPIVNDDYQKVVLGYLSDLEWTADIGSIRRVDGMRTITVSVIPSSTMTMEETIDAINQVVLPEVDNILPKDTIVEMGNSAGSLDRLKIDIAKMLLLGSLTLALLLVIEFKSVLSVIISVLTLPMAALGGLIGYIIISSFFNLSFDLIAIFGFVILLGIVINNAVLLLSQVDVERNNGHTLLDALSLAIEGRSRAVVLSTVTTIVGMLPLALFPGEGSQIYQGLAAILIGGLIANLMFVMLLVPALCRVFVSNEQARSKQTLTEQPIKAE